MEQFDNAGKKETNATLLKVSTPLLLFIFLIFVLGGLSLFFPGNQGRLNISQEEVSGWKTYKNNAYGFEFKYPKEFYLGFDAALSNETGSEYVQSLNRGSQTIPIYVGIIPKDSTMTKGNKALEAKEMKDELSHTSTTTPIRTIIFGDRKGVLVDFQIHIGDPYEALASTYNDNGDQVFVRFDNFGASREEPLDDQEIRLVEAIVSTFKFTK